MRHVTPWAAPQVEGQMEAAQRVVTALRGLRQQYGLQRQRPAVALAVSQPGVADGLEAAAACIETLSTSLAVTVIRVRKLCCWADILLLNPTRMYHACELPHVLPGAPSVRQ